MTNRKLIYGLVASLRPPRSLRDTIKLSFISRRAGRVRREKYLHFFLTIHPQISPINPIRFSR